MKYLVLHYDEFIPVENLEWYKMNPNDFYLSAYSFTEKFIDWIMRKKKKNQPFYVVFEIFFTPHADELLKDVRDKLYVTQRIKLELLAEKQVEMRKSKRVSKTCVKRTFKYF